MAAPLGVANQKSKDHRRRKNGASAEFFAKQRAATNAARGKQVWIWDNESQNEGHWERVIPDGSTFRQPL
jgi:hypothetical protein